MEELERYLAAYSAALWTWSRNRLESPHSSRKSKRIALLPSRQPITWVRDIIENAKAIVGYTAGFTEKSFGHN